MNTSSGTSLPTTEQTQEIASLIRAVEKAKNTLPPPRRSRLRLEAQRRRIRHPHLLQRDHDVQPRV